MKQGLPLCLVFAVGSTVLMIASSTPLSADVGVSRKMLRSAKPTTALAAPTAASDGKGHSGTEAWQQPGFPDVMGLMTRVRAALQPFERDYLQERGEMPTDTAAVAAAANGAACGYEDARPGFLGNCPPGGCLAFRTLEEAKKECDRSLHCGGITRNVMFEVRAGNSLLHSSSGEVSYTRKSCKAAPLKSAASVYSAFYHTVKEALTDKNLNLLKKLGPPRNDGSIFLSIASYRDNACGPTLRRAFERAKHPEKLFVGIVQMNCGHHCMTGTGWGMTRRWVPGAPDPDCASAFCASDFGRPFCEGGHVRVVRLEERDALGPYFSRFLNSRLYRAETYYMQIDSHTNFRQDWDTTLVEQIKRTPNHPRSIISNYPPEGKAQDMALWQPFDPSRDREETLGLCSATFEDHGLGSTAVRFDRSNARVRAKDTDDPLAPPFSCFIAAGFFFGGGQLVDEVPFDPFMPWVFMGEELAFTIRFWTSGFDIHRPAADVVRHEYFRSEHPKFWESVTMIFSKPSMHNDLVSYILPRLHLLVGSKHVATHGQQSDAVDPGAEPLGSYGLGANRTKDNFFKLVAMDFDGRLSRAPTWYEDRQTPPASLRLLEHVVA